MAIDVNEPVSSVRSTTTQSENGEFKKDIPSSMVERITLILDAFDGRAARLNLEEVAYRTRLPRSTVHRILDQLVKLDWVNHSSIGYGLGRRAFGLGGGHSQIREAAAPVLHELHLRTGLVVHLSVLDVRDSVYLDKVGGRLATGLPSRVGGRIPAHSTAGGKAMLACITPERVDALFGATLPRRTEKTIGEIGELHQELNRIRQRRGLAFERGEAARGVACVAAVIRGPEGYVGSIALCGDIRTAQLERVAPLVGDAAREVSRSLIPELDAPRRGRKALTVSVDNFSAAMMDSLLFASSDQWI
ncbi:IclR family transcriptional regulator [Rhodococcus sp. ARC_M6]|uniref:IclR family transcriptional regulator n=1 Tax=Rhodococcus sp. ARC_M6 TaxID=2928852 RepID=UPI0035AFCF8A